MELLFALIPTGILAALLYLKERQLAAVLAASELARQEQTEQAARERAQLIALVQAPEASPSIAAMAEPSGELLHVPLDDDAAHDEYMEQRAMGEVR
jgi:hypothetical protein